MNYLLPESLVSKIQFLVSLLFIALVETSILTYVLNFIILADKAYYCMVII